LIVSDVRQAGEWRCGRCEGRNHREATHCASCDTVKGTAYFPAVPRMIEEKARHPKERLADGAKRSTPHGGGKKPTKAGLTTGRRSNPNLKGSRELEAALLRLADGRSITDVLAEVVDRRRSVELSGGDGNEEKTRKTLEEVMRDDDPTTSPPGGAIVSLSSGTADESKTNNNNNNNYFVHSSGEGWDVDAPSDDASTGNPDDEWGHVERIDTTNIDDLDPPSSSHDDDDNHTYTTTRNATTAPASSTDLSLGESKGEYKETKDGKASDEKTNGTESATSPRTIVQTPPPLSRQKSYAVLRSSEISE
jgi:hypothetical protein